MKKIIGSAVSFLFVLGISNSPFPIFISYSFWEEFCQDPSACGGGYEWGLMNFKEALIFTPNKWVVGLDWVLLAVYSVLLTVILLRLIVRFRK